MLGIIIEIDALAAYRQIRNSLGVEERANMPDREQMMPVVWGRMSCKNSEVKESRQCGNWQLYLQQLIGCKYLTTHFISKFEVTME